MKHLTNLTNADTGPSNHNQCHLDRLDLIQVAMAVRQEIILVSIEVPGMAELVPIPDTKVLNPQVVRLCLLHTTQIILMFPFLRILLQTLHFYIQDQLDTMADHPPDLPEAYCHTCPLCTCMGPMGYLHH
jgi:hypothetical protein